MRIGKLLVLTVTVLGTTGALIAFQMPKFGTSKYCYFTTESEPEAGVCISKVQNALALDYVGGTKVFYTTTNNLDDCANATCPNVSNGFIQ